MKGRQAAYVLHPSGLGFVDRFLPNRFTGSAIGSNIGGGERMITNCADQTAIPSRTTRHIPSGSWGIVLSALFVCVCMGTMAHAEDQSIRKSEATEVSGKLVKNFDGKSIGKIKDLVINWRSGSYIEYAVLSFGGFFGLGDEYIAVPWKALTLSENKEYLVLNMEEKHLRDAGRFLVYRFYDRSSVAARRGDRSTAAPFAQMMKGDRGDDVNVSASRLFGMQYACC
jgi:sporulation protein YlmC with PRC-barrel domain